MKTWQEFNDTVNDLLLVDGLRKGRGVEKFRDRMIVAGVRDLMAYIPELRTTPAEESFSKSELELHGEKQCMIGQFDVESARILDVIVRQLPYLLRRYYSYCQSRLLFRLLLMQLKT